MSWSDERIRARLDFLEAEAQQRPGRHALRLIGLAALGYLYPLVLVLGSFGLVAVILAAAPHIAAEEIDLRMLLYAAAAAGAALLAVVVLRTLLVTLPAPDGYALRPGDAPLLLAMVEEVRGAMSAPRIDRVLLDVR